MGNCFLFFFSLNFLEIEFLFLKMTKIEIFFFFFYKKGHFNAPAIILLLFSNVILYFFHIHVYQKDKLRMLTEKV